MHFGYKSGFSFTNIHLSVTNIAFGFTKWLLGLLLSIGVQDKAESLNFILYTILLCFLR